jgi:hypothetical protein
MQMMVEGDCFAEEGGNGGMGGWVCCASFDGEQDWSCDCAGQVLKRLFLRHAVDQRY